MAQEMGGSRAHLTPQDSDRRAWDTSWTERQKPEKEQEPERGLPGLLLGPAAPMFCYSLCPFSSPPTPAAVRAKAVRKDALWAIHPDTGRSQGLCTVRSFLFPTLPFKVVVMLGLLHPLSSLGRGEAKAVKVGRRRKSRHGHIVSPSFI